MAASRTIGKLWLKFNCLGKLLGEVREVFRRYFQGEQERETPIFFMENLKRSVLVENLANNLSKKKCSNYLRIERSLPCIGLVFTSNNAKE